jgi:hypothetical protein
MDSLTSRHKLTLNRDGYEGPEERNDCTVRAIQNVTGVPYIDGHRWTGERGRRNRKGMAFVSLMDRVAASKELVYGYRVRKVDVNRHAAVVTAFGRRRYVGPTLAEVMPQLRHGRYVVVITGHTFAVIDGVIHDMGHNGARCRVSAVYQFEPSSVVEAREAQGGGQ